MRTSKHDVHITFRDLCEAADVEPLGLPGGTPVWYRDEWGDGTSRTRDNEGWALDYAPSYGGWRIDSHGGAPVAMRGGMFGDGRMAPREFVRAMVFATRILEEVKVAR